MWVGFNNLPPPPPPPPPPSSSRIKLQVFIVKMPLFHGYGINEHPITEMNPLCCPILLLIFANFTPRDLLLDLLAKNLPTPFPNTIDPSKMAGQQRSPLLSNPLVSAQSRKSLQR